MLGCGNIGDEESWSLTVEDTGGEMPRTSVVSAMTRNSSRALPKARENGEGRLRPEGSLWSW